MKYSRLAIGFYGWAWLNELNLKAFRTRLAFNLRNFALQHNVTGASYYQNRETA